MFPDNADESVDLAHVFAGGRVVFTSDQHFGVGSNLLLPGRGELCDRLNPPQALDTTSTRQGHGRWMGDEEKPRQWT